MEEAQCAEERLTALIDERDRLRGAIESHQIRFMEAHGEDGERDHAHWYDRALWGHLLEKSND